MTAHHAKSLLELRLELVRAGVEHDWLIGTNESLITRARNEMTASFLKSSHTHMFWLDADIEFAAEDIQKVWNLDADIGVGVYAMKKRDKQWFAAWKDGALIKDLDQFHGPIEVDYAGTGFMCIKREVVEKVIQYRKDRAEKAERLVELARDDEERGLLSEMAEGMAATYTGNLGEAPAIYMTPVHLGGLESEDYFFCRIAREAGYKVMMDPSVRLRHWGQYAFGA